MIKNSFPYIIAKNIKISIDNIKYRNKLNKFNTKYDFDTFSYEKFKTNITEYLKTNKGDIFYKYKFSNSRDLYELYSSIYAVMTIGLLDEIELLTNKEKKAWAEYILSFQKENGLFVDNYLETPSVSKIHYWGWYHLLPHLIIALDYLGEKPKYDFQFLYKQFENQTPEQWLESRKWRENYLAVSNEIMNITVLLQYSRDMFQNEIAKDYVNRILTWLEQNKIDKKTGLWGFNTNRSKHDISKAVKTAYHFLPMFIYDSRLENLNIDNLIKFTLKTQNDFGTYGPCNLTDGCEDIDSLYLLTQLPINNSLKTEVNKSIERFFNSVFYNMNNDGGFVFKRIQSFQYADSKLQSNPDESNMFGTWFRTLSIAYACKYLNIKNNFKFANISGYQFYKEVE